MTPQGLSQQVCENTQNCCESALISDLVEVLSCSPHLLPGFIEQLNTDAEELLPGSVMGEEHGMIIVTAFIC